MVEESAAAYARRRRSRHAIAARKPEPRRHLPSPLARRGGCGARRCTPMPCCDDGPMTHRAAARRERVPLDQQHRGHLRPRDPRAEGRVARSAARAGSSALLGANGAGKTTTLKAISNLLRAERGDVTKGTIEFEGRRVDRLTPNELVQLRRVPGDGRPALLRAPDGRGEPADRRVHAQRDRAREIAARPREGLSATFPRLKAAARRAWRATPPAASSR